MALVHIHANIDAKRIITKLDTIIDMLKVSAEKETKMTVELDELTAAVEENTTLDNSVIQLVEGLAAQILALKDDPAKLAALSASLKASSAAVAAAIAANTPTAPSGDEV